MERRSVLGRYDLYFGEVKKSQVIQGQLTIITLALCTCGERQSASFSATYEQYEKDKPEPRKRDNGLVSCGRGVEQFTKRFSKTAKYFGWHLANIDSGPTHYIANAKFWYEKYLKGGDTGRYGNNWDAARCLQAAESCAHWSMLPGEEPGGLAVAFDKALSETAPFSGDWWGSVLEQLLRDRFPALMEAYIRDMTELFGAEAVAEAVAHAESLKKVKP